MAFGRDKQGFTIVELLMVVVVIAILATITVVAFNGVRNNAVDASVKNTLSSAVKKLESYKINNSAYPGSLSVVGLESTDTVTLQYTGDSATYCVSGTSPRSTTIGYRVSSEDPSVQQGVCDDHAGPGEDIADEPDSWLTQSTVGRAVAPGDMEFTAETNEDWTQVVLSWSSMPDAVQYRVNHRNSPEGGWYVKNSNGSGNLNSAYAWDSAQNGRSGAINPETVSLTWGYSMPAQFDAIHSYRIQYLNDDGDWNDFQELSLSPHFNRDMPKIRNFKVVPNEDWSSIGISWDGMGEFAKLPGVKYRLNHRNSPEGEWYVKTSIGSGNLNSAYAWNRESYSGVIDPDTTSQSWTYSIPHVATAPHEYRIQVYGGSIVGEWAEFVLDPLENIDVPAVSNFKVTPSGDWSSIDISWDEMGDFANIPGAKFRLNHRNSLDSPWYVKAAAGNGNLTTGWSWDKDSYSGVLGHGVTSQSWIYSIPSPGQTHQYRIQVYSGEASGSWSTVTLSR